MKLKLAILRVRIDEFESSMNNRFDELIKKLSPPKLQKQTNPQEESVVYWNYCKRKKEQDLPIIPNVEEKLSDRVHSNFAKSNAELIKYCRSRGFTELYPNEFHY